MIRVTIWNEFRHEKKVEEVKKLYPNGMHAVIKEFLEKNDDITCRLAALDDEDCGIPQEVLDETDVLIWWGHMHHWEVPDEVVDRVQKAVHAGMGLIVLHSGHHSRIFKALTGTPCSLGWRENEFVRFWVADPSHPITQGIDRYFELDEEEVYCEPFSIPEPDKLLFISWYESGEVFRSGCTYKRGNGNIFYFQPGHETYGAFHNAEVLTVIRNAIRWAAPIYRTRMECPWVKPPMAE